MMTKAPLLAAALLLASPETDPVDEAVSELVSCRDMKAPPCLRAASTLMGADDESRAIQALSGAFSRMRRAGKALSISVLSQLDGEASTEALGEVATDASTSPSIRTMSVQELGSRFDDASRPIATGALLEALEADDATVRAAAARALGNRVSEDSERVLDALMEAAEDDDPNVRREAILGLGMSRSPSAGPTLLRALDDEDDGIRKAAAEAFTFVEYDEAIGPLIELLKSDDAALRRIVGEALEHQTGHDYGDDYPLWREWYESR